MEAMNGHLLRVLTRKALTSSCEYRIAALALNKKSEVVARATNLRRFYRKGGGLHAEMRLMALARKRGIKTIVICRVGKSGMLLPIDPCPMCAQKARELGIKIVTMPRRRKNGDRNSS